MADSKPTEYRSNSPVPCSGQRPYESYKPPDGNVQLSEAISDVHGYFEENGHGRPDGDNTVVPKKSVDQPLDRQVSTCSDAGHRSSDLDKSLQSPKSSHLELNTHLQYHSNQLQAHDLDSAGDSSTCPSESKELKSEVSKSDTKDSATVPGDFIPERQRRGDNTVVPKKSVDQPLDRQASTCSDAGYRSSDLDKSLQSPKSSHLELNTHPQYHSNQLQAHDLDSAGDSSTCPSESKELKSEVSKSDTKDSATVPGDFIPERQRRGSELSVNDSAYNSLATLPSLEETPSKTNYPFLKVASAVAVSGDAVLSSESSQSAPPSEDGSSVVSTSTKSTAILSDDSLEEEEVFARVTLPRCHEQLQPHEAVQENILPTGAAQHHAHEVRDVGSTSRSSAALIDITSDEAAEDVYADLAISLAQHLPQPIPTQPVSAHHLTPPKENNTTSSGSSVTVLSRQSSFEPSNNAPPAHGSGHAEENTFTGLAPSLAQHRSQVSQDQEGTATSSGSSVEVISRQLSVGTSSRNAAHFASFLYDEDGSTGYHLEESDGIDGGGGAAASNSSLQNPTNSLLPNSDVPQYFEMSCPMIRGYSPPRNLSADDHGPPRNPPADDHWSAVGNNRTQIQEQALPQAPSMNEKRKMAKRHLPEWPFTIRIQRKNIVPTLWHMYTSYPKLWTFRPAVYRYFDEAGIDMGGVTKDVMATFWKEVREVFVNDIKITLIPNLCKGNCKCEMYSSILVHSFLLTGQVPSYLHELFVCGIFCSPEKNTPVFRQKCTQLFIDLFYDTQFVQEKLIASCDSGLSKENKEFMKEFLGQYELPLPQDFTKFATYLEELVFKQLFRSPPHFVKLCCKKLSRFFELLTPYDAQEVWDSLRPSGETVARNLRCAYTPQSGSREANTLEFLKQWLRRNENAHLIEAFLKWVTGSCALTDPIKIRFNDKFKLPYVSTCSLTMTLPTKYASYEAFDGMMMETLNTVESQIFSSY